MQPASRLLALLGLGLGGCTTLGPTPLGTGLSARPEGRSDLTAMASVLPGYYLSDATRERPEPAPLGGLAAVVEPDGHAPGLVLGLRTVSGGGEHQLEPVLGYRRWLSASHELALAGFVTGTVASGAEDGASYDAARAAGELVLDGQVARSARFALSMTAAAQLSVTRVTGDYCADEAGFGVDCDGATDVHTVRDLVSPSVTLGLALDIARGRASAFHGARVGFGFSLVGLPQVQAGHDTAEVAAATVGASFSLSLGDDR